MPSATPTVVEIGAGAPLLMLSSVVCLPDRPHALVREGDALAFFSAPTEAFAFVFGSGVAPADVVVPPRLLAVPTPATLPQ